MTAAAARRIVIIGGGFAGSLLALRLAGTSAISPILIETGAQAGPGLAYGAAETVHALNVPVNRMEVGLEPGFQSWLGAFASETAEAIAEAGDLAQAFVSRRLFGRYMAERVEAAVATGAVRRVHGEAVGLRQVRGAYEVELSRGERLEADAVVLATGNLPPRAPNVKSPDGRELGSARAFICDPWARGALAAVRDDAPVLLLGSGLTSVDVALALLARGHKADIHIVSRHGLLPRVHVSGGAWPSFSEDAIGRSPLQLLKLFRTQAAAARRHGVPWQRVIDAARPDIARMWSAWDEKARGRFLRHGRTLWDVHRHRMPARVASRFIDLLEGGQLQCHAGRLMGFKMDGKGLHVAICPRRSREGRDILVDHVINCTGPAGTYAEVDTPLYVDLLRQGLIRPDRLHLGLETVDTRIVGEDGQTAPGLYALGGLTRPAWWEITAVPDIQAQVSRLAARLLEPDPRDRNPMDAVARKLASNA